MDSSFRIIGITPERLPGDYQSEVARIVNLLQSGRADIIHLRHPNASIDEMRRYLRVVPEDILPHITLHDHYSLTREFNIGGLHLNSRNPFIPDVLSDYISNKSIRISRSCHSLEEIENLCNPSLKNQFFDGSSLEYVTLSPIFDSISKKGYKSRFNLNELKGILPSVPMKVIALGGVQPSYFSQLKSAGFGGAALLGYFFPDS